MGVSGLWAEIKPVAVRQSFEKTALAVFDEAFEEVQDGQPIKKGTTLGLRVGIDASAWFIHSEKSEGGANPVLRNLFHRVVRLARAGARALFVFDGPHRPSIKRGHRIYRGTHAIQRDFERIAEAFGFEWRTAPGEAEAELAYLNRRGLLDLVITDDVDCLLFGASTLMKHALVNQVTESIQPQLFERGTIELELDLTVPGLVLVALMSGGDYDTGGLTGIGPKLSLALAKAGYGERLEGIMTGSSGKDMEGQLRRLRDDIRHEMRTNASGLFERKAGAAANKFHDNWPDIAVANSYYNAATSELRKYRHFDKAHLWDRKIDVPALVEIMDGLFEYTHAEILQKLRSQIWECMVIQDLIWIICENGVAISRSVASSPSKVLAASLGSVSLNGGSSLSDSSSLGSVVLQRVEKKRAVPKKAENHVTDELQLIVDPSPAAALAQKYLRHPDPNVGKLEIRKEAEAAAIRAVHGPDHPGAIPAPPRNSHYDDPYEVQKIWIPESLLRLALPAMTQSWEDREQAKAEAKARKGKNVAGKRPPSDQKTAKVPAQAGNIQRSPKAPEKLAKVKIKPIVNTDSEPEDLFAPTRKDSRNMFPSLPLLSHTSQTSYILKDSSVRAPTSTAEDNYVKEHSRPASPSSSDSDIQLVSASHVTRLKSPKKSPRKDANQKTARGATGISAMVKAKPLSTSAMIPFNTVKKGGNHASAASSNKGKDQQRTSKTATQANQKYTYGHLVDSDSDSGQDSLPPLTRLLKPKDKSTSSADKGGDQQRTSKTATQAKQKYTYEHLVDSDSESGQDSLPPLTRLLKPKDKSTGSADNEAVRSASAPISRYPKSNSVSSTAEMTSVSVETMRSRSQTHNESATKRRPNGGTVIDLCSSD